MSKPHSSGPWKVAMGNFAENGDARYILDGIKTIGSKDAKLIAAAHDLLDALKLAQLHINGGPGIQSGVAWWAMYDQIKEAIAKATGKAP